MKLYGYDQQLKYKTNKITKSEFEKIFNLVDQMPMRKLEIQQAGNMKLYTDDNPENTLKNTGFVNKKKALQTLKIIKG